MLDKCQELTRYIHQKQFESAFVPNAFSVASTRRDERESRESRPGGETTFVSSQDWHLLSKVRAIFLSIHKMSASPRLQLPMKKANNQSIIYTKISILYYKLKLFFDLMLKCFYG